MLTLKVNNENSRTMSLLYPLKTSENRSYELIYRWEQYLKQYCNIKYIDQNIKNVIWVNATYSSNFSKLVLHFGARNRISGSKL